RSGRCWRTTASRSCLSSRPVWGRRRAPAARPRRLRLSNPNLRVDAREEGRTEMIRPWQLMLCATALGLLLTAGVFGQSPEAKKLNPYNGKAEAIQQGRTLWLQN